MDDAEPVRHGQRYVTDDTLPARAMDGAPQNGANILFAYVMDDDEPVRHG